MPGAFHSASSGSGGGTEVWAFWLPDGGGGDPTGIVSNHSGKDWVAEVAHTGIGVMPAGRNSGKEYNDGWIVPRIGQNPLRSQLAGRNDVARVRNQVLGWDN